MTEKLSSRQLRSCAACGKRKNLEWDGRRKLCHECLLARIDEVIELHHQNKIAYHEAESELMERLRIGRLEAESRLQPPIEDWNQVSAPASINIGGMKIEFDENGDLVDSLGNTLPLGGDGEVS